MCLRNLYLIWLLRNYDIKLFVFSTLEVQNWLLFEIVHVIMVKIYIILHINTFLNIQALLVFCMTLKVQIRWETSQENTLIAGKKFSTFYLNLASGTYRDLGCLTILFKMSSECFKSIRRSHFVCLLNVWFKT